jgi:oligoendopeptidase F
MAHPNEIKQAVKNEYVINKQPLTVACHLHGVSYATGQAWKRKAKQQGKSWEKERNADHISEKNLEERYTQLLEEFAIRYDATMQKLATDTDLTAEQHIKMIASIADSMTKINAAFKNFAPNISELSIAMDVLRHLSLFIKENNPEQVEFFLEVLEPFGDELSTHYG